MVPHGQPGPWQTSRDSRILRPENFQLTEFGGQPGKLGPAVRGGLDKLWNSFRSTGLRRDFASSRDGTDSAAISGVTSGVAAPVPLHGPPRPPKVDTRIIFRIFLVFCVFRVARRVPTGFYLMGSVDFCNSGLGDRRLESHFFSHGPRWRSGQIGPIRFPPAPLLAIPGSPHSSSLPHSSSNHPPVPSAAEGSKDRVGRRQRKIPLRNGLESGTDLPSLRTVLPNSRCPDDCLNHVSISHGALKSESWNRKLPALEHVAWHSSRSVAGSFHRLNHSPSLSAEHCSA